MSILLLSLQVELCYCHYVLEVRTNTNDSLKFAEQIKVSLQIFLRLVTIYSYTAQ